MADQSLLFLSALETGRLIRARKVSSVELTRACLEALDTRGRELNAVAELTPQLALQQAEQADREISAGHVRGPLHGVPYGAKDLLAVSGIPTRWGSPAHQDQVFDYDAAVVERLREAGAVLVAKLAMIELAGGGGYEFASASATGPCRNPYDPSRWAGGSSSGSGAAVAAGLVGFAIGSETWGSIMTPAAFCNITGLRPTYGRVPRFGAMALSFTMDKIGPMARCAEDCGRILEAIAGPDPRDPSCGGGRFRFRSRALARHRFRLGVLPRNYDASQAADAETRFAAALDVFRSMGHQTVPAKLPDFPYDNAAGTIIAAEGAAAFEGLIRSPALGKLADRFQQSGLLAELTIPATEYLRAMQLRAVAGPAAVRVFEECDALVAPTLVCGAPSADRSFFEGGRQMGGNGGPANLLGWPSISVPMGPGADDLPLGLELIGAPYQEQTLLTLAMAFQRATPWHLRRPRLSG